VWASTVGVVALVADDIDQSLIEVTHRIEWCPPFYFFLQLDVVTSLSKSIRNIWLVKNRTSLAWAFGTVPTAIAIASIILSMLGPVLQSKNYGQTGD